MDETSDISRKEQISISVRFVNAEGENPEIKEEFLLMHEVEDLTGAGIKKKIHESVNFLGLIQGCLYYITNYV